VNGIVHPFTLALYERTGDGNILVTEKADPHEDPHPKKGLFRRDGSWIEGELFECDPHLCGWIAGPQIANQRLKPPSGKAPAE
jgi:hypothetical protein